MTHPAEAPARAGGLRIERALLSALDPQDAQRQHLRTSGVNEHRIAALYPTELSELIEAFRRWTEAEGAGQHLGDVLSERQFETAVDCLPYSLAQSTKAKLERLGQDDRAKWDGAFAVATGGFNAGWLTYQFANLFAFAHALTTAPSLEPEISMALPGATPEQEHYDSAWRMITLWVKEAEDVAQQIARIVREHAASVPA